MPFAAVSKRGYVQKHYCENDFHYSIYSFSSKSINFLYEDSEVGNSLLN